MSVPAQTLAKGVESYLSRCGWVGDCLVSLTRKPTYGEIRSEEGAMPAHRAVYFIKVGRLPKGLVVRHRCDNPPCVNVDHLVAGTPAQNSHDIHERNRRSTASMGARGTANRSAVLNDAVVADMRNRVRAGESVVSVAEDVGVSHAAARQAVRGGSWKHVTTPPVPSAIDPTNYRGGGRRVSDDLVPIALALKEQGSSLSEIGVSLGVSRCTAFALIHRIAG